MSDEDNLTLCKTSDFISQAMKEITKLPLLVGVQRVLTSVN